MNQQPKIVVNMSLTLAQQLDEMKPEGKSLTGYILSVLKSHVANNSSKEETNREHHSQR